MTSLVLDNTTMRYRYKYKRNSRKLIDIFGDILKVLESEGPTKKTRLVFRAYLDYPNCNIHIEYLVQAGLVIFGKDSKYHITAKGKRFVQLYRNMTNLIVFKT